MATIPNYPQSLMDEHSRWHMNHMNMDVRSGDGIEFLRFHRHFLRESLSWYKGQKLDPSLVAPWSAIPPEIKMHPRWTRQLQEADNRITNNLASFKTSDELGRFLLTSSLHNAVHAIGGEVFNDFNFSQISLSPRSTLFYNWHRLIDRWWSELQRINRSRRRRTASPHLQKKRK